MEQQGAAARYANCGDDENSQAEGTSEGAVGYSRPADSTNNNTNTPNNNQNQSAHPHYENIYESIDQYAAPVAAPAVTTENHNNNANNATASTSGQSIQQTPPTQQLNSNVVIAPPGTSRSIPVQSVNGGAHRNPIYRNEMYSDRTGGYDVPRQMFRPQNYSTNGATGTTTKRRANLHLDLNPNRPRYTTASRPHRQRSFDDTESNYYNNFRYENIYEQIHEEPIYRNFNGSAGSANIAGGHTNRMYGRLGVIGHGIGRIERHLSSSCGNIDHYNLGGHYAVLGHSHLGTVGHIRLNAGAAPAAGGTAKDTNGAVKSLNFFSCLGRENSQSMNNIHRAANPTAPTADRQTNFVAPTTATPILRSGTGAIPKTPKLKKSCATSHPSNDDSETESTTSNTHDSSLNRISKSSLQWLLVNKWLPMWIGQEPDYNILDFNFMFSRNCGGCGDTFNRQQSVVRFNGHAEMRARPDQGVARRQFANNGTTGGSLRPMRLNHSLTRLRECEHGAVLRRDGSLDERNRQHRENPYDRDRYREDYYERLARQRAERARETDPFRNWELNTENNSFRPAGQRDIRRITDGTYPAPVAGTSTGNMQRQAKEPAKAGASKAMERLVNPRLDSRTESGNESPSPDLGGRRYSDNTEDDQHNDDDVRDIDDD